MRRFMVRLAPILVLSLTLSSCIDELAEIFDIILFSESDDPQIRETGETIAERRAAREAKEALDRFKETGDRSHLEAAIALRPDDTSLRGYAVVAATQGADPADIAATKEALTLAEARRLSRLTEPGDSPVTAEMVRRNVLGEILVAQTEMLGGDLNRPWDPPGTDAPLLQQQLYLDYCDTRNQIWTDHRDDLSYLYLPPCPGS